jgi:hypothetical protein
LFQDFGALLIGQYCVAFAILAHRDACDAQLSKDLWLGNRSTSKSRGADTLPSDSIVDCRSLVPSICSTKPRAMGRLIPTTLGALPSERRNDRSTVREVEMKRRPRWSKFIACPRQVVALPLVRQATIQSSKVEARA